MRFIGWVLVLVGLAALIGDIYFFVAGDVLYASREGANVDVIVIGEFRFHAVAEYWQAIHANSLIGFSAFLERNIGDQVFADYLLPILALPAFMVFMVPGAILLLIFRGNR